MIARACVPWTWLYGNPTICHSFTVGMLRSIWYHTTLLLNDITSLSPFLAASSQRRAMAYRSLYECHYVRFELLTHWSPVAFSKQRHVQFRPNTTIAHHNIITPQILTSLSISLRNAKESTYRSSHRLVTRLNQCQGDALTIPITANPPSTLMPLPTPR